MPGTVRKIRMPRLFGMLLLCSLVLAGLVQVGRIYASPSAQK